MSAAPLGPSALAPASRMHDPEPMPRADDAVRVVIRRRADVPAAEVIALLSADPATFLGAGPTGSTGEHHVLPLRVRFAGVHFDRSAAVGFGPLVEEDDGARILPVWWEAAEQPWLFPIFTGGLEVRSGDGGTELRLEGHYRPPLGAAGLLVNRAVLNRAASASLEALLDRLVIRLTDGQVSA
jgi:hypothetical protein